MAHLRQQIREQISTTLTGLTTTGSNVFQSRIYNVEQSLLPCLLVYTTDESVIIPATTIGTIRNIERDLTVIVEGLAQGTTNIDDTIDTISKEVEVAMQADIKVNSLAVDSYLISTLIEHDGEGKQHFARVKLSYRVEYRNAENDPETAV